MTQMMTTQAQQAALDDLDCQWGEVYELAITRAGWVAHRLHNGRWLLAAGPEGLHELIVADYAAMAVASGAYAEQGS
jgi:hypothetical protein